jgi:hypothetical protein
MSAAITRGVLQSLVVEDRPWTVEELIRDQGERSEVEDALADLHAVGLVKDQQARGVRFARSHPRRRTELLSAWGHTSAGSSA